MLLLDYKQSLSFSHILFKVTWACYPSILTSCVPNLGAIESNTIFCEISLVTVPEAPISATPEDEVLKQGNIKLILNQR